MFTRLLEKDKECNCSEWFSACCDCGDGDGGCGCPGCVTCNRCDKCREQDENYSHTV